MPIVAAYSADRRLVVIGSYTILVERRSEGAGSNAAFDQTLYAFRVRELEAALVEEANTYGRHLQLLHARIEKLTERNQRLIEARDKLKLRVQEQNETIAAHEISLAEVTAQLRGQRDEH